MLVLLAYVVVPLDVMGRVRRVLEGAVETLRPCVEVQGATASTASLVWFPQYSLAN